MSRAARQQEDKQHCPPQRYINMMPQTQIPEFQLGIQHGSAAAATATAAQPPLAVGSNEATGRDPTIPTITTLPDRMADTHANINATAQGHVSLPPVLRSKRESAFLAEVAFLSGSSSTPPHHRAVPKTATPSPPRRGHSRSLGRGTEAPEADSPQAPFSQGRSSLGLQSHGAGGPGDPDARRHLQVAGPRLREEVGRG